MAEQGMDPFGVVTSLKRGGALVDNKCKSLLQQMDGIGDSMDSFHNTHFMNFLNNAKDSAEKYCKAMRAKPGAYKKVLEKGNVLKNALQTGDAHKEKTVSDNEFSL